MEISKTFVVKASPEATWAFLTDPRRVAQCLPGAAVTDQIDEHTHAGTITMKVGPVAANFKGTMRFESLDAAARTAEIVAKGQDVRGKGGADMRMTSRLVERGPGETEVTITSNVNIIGSLAQFGRGIVQDVADQVFEKFVIAVRGHLETPAAPAPPAGGGPVASAAAPAAPVAEPLTSVPPIEVFSTASGAVGRAASRAAFSPALWIGILVVILLVYWLFSR
jgi:carbon monoxide dehydrogenase subunit G